MKVLVIGNGGRESAIVRALSKSKRVTKIYASPGNPGMSQEAELIEFKDFGQMYNDIVKYRIDLVVVGPEQYLSEGIVDYLSKRNVPAIGPNKMGAQLESSKLFAKKLMQKNGIPTANFVTFTEYQDALNYVKNVKYPIVIKADGLAAGKGVFISENHEQSALALRQMMKDMIFGAAGAQVVIEDFLVGWEGSVFAFTDGDNYQLTVVSQDHKRIYDGDLGPNTGGMGAYAPIDSASPYLPQIAKEIFDPLLKGLKQEGILYKGVIYAGIIFTAEGPYILEYNCRLGDPETQAVLPLLETDFVDICESIHANEIKKLDLKWQDKYSVNVVAASKGYPDKYEKEKLVTINPKLNEMDDVELFYANVTRKNNSNELYTDGGRVLSLTALASTLPEAISKVYTALEYVNFDNIYYRKDIAHKRAE
jgi:phosphoribosylamine--glycine ligase